LKSIYTSAKSEDFKELPLLVKLNRFLLVVVHHLHASRFVADDFANIILFRFNILGFGFFEAFLLGLDVGVDWSLLFKVLQLLDIRGRSFGVAEPSTEITITNNLNMRRGQAIDSSSRDYTECEKRRSDLPMELHLAARGKVVEIGLRLLHGDTKEFFVGRVASGVPHLGAQDRLQQSNAMPHLLEFKRAIRSLFGHPCIQRIVVDERLVPKKGE